MFSVMRMRINPQAPDSESRRRNRPPADKGAPSEGLRSPQFTRVASIGGIVVLLIAIAAAAGPQVRAFLDFGVGVLSLVSLSCSVIWGLVSTDTLILGPRHRITTQAVHRILGIAAVSFLIMHVTTKIVEGHATLVQAFVPFGTTGEGILVALGVIAGYLMILAAVTGAMRSVFVVKRHPVRWRILHAMAYVSWCMALIHGLEAGRKAKFFFVASYGIAVLGVAIVLLVRMRSVRGESLFSGPEVGVAAEGKGGLGGMGGGSGRRRAEPSGRSDGIPLAYIDDPLPPLPNFPLTPPAPAAPSYDTGQIPAYNTGQIPAYDPGQLPPAAPIYAQSERLDQAPPVYAQQQPGGQLPPGYAQPPDATQQMPPIPGQRPYDGTPPYGTGAVPPEDPTDIGATRLQPVAWQQPGSAPYFGEQQR
jgi:DMSO/TMAO reductase YedYZ heme-binding membrane subunit